ncbi:PAS domain S-box protein [Bradyrhizobium sp. CB82]|uniref:GAF domain-containing protein n=1 Tax=Bradyrhizobium sp. CB82 TaxID=3039159 RepID=UPI0024B265C1|nr:PAS domain S-box protein [Bradyrhizobium sp. CB82]WFU37250.1 PAS domain S-box protein [Bradyrhizobium sp. CB82]
MHCPQCAVRPLRRARRQDGVLRTDLTGRIRFANERATEILGFSEADLKKMLLSEALELEGEDAGERQAEWLDAQTGFSGFVKFRTRDGQPIPARISGAPYLEGPNSRAGLLLLFAPLAEDLARQELKTILVDHEDPQEIIEATLGAIRKVIPFEMATFGIYNEACDHWRALAIVPQPQWEWTTRWFRVSPGVIDWLKQGRTWDNDLHLFVERLNPDEMDNPVSKAILRDGLDRMIVLPIREAGGRFRSALCLLSRTHKFTAADLRTLHNLGVEEVLQAADAAMERSRALAQRQLRDDLNKAVSTRAIAELLAKGTMHCFGWEYVGVFRVDRARSCFVLFAEHCENDRDLLVREAGSREEYTQSLSAGMLGHCLAKQSILVVPDVTDRERNYGFIRTAPDQRSAMTVPLFVNGKIEMVLDLESSEFNAFLGPDLEAARGLASDCEQIFAARWHQTIEDSLMNRIEQAAVIVDGVGEIRRLNRAAEAMLGQVRGTRLASFGARDEDCAELAQSGIQHRIRIRLLTGAEPRVEVATLANRDPLFDDYGHHLWLFTSLADQSRESDLQYLEETVTAVARQTRAPLLMADGLLRGAKNLLREPEQMQDCASLLDQAANHLLKADLTFERLSERLTVQKIPRDAPIEFDALQGLEREIDNLPQEDREAVAIIDKIDPTARALVKGWPERLSFAFRSALGSLLMLRVTPTDKLTVEIAESPPRHLLIRMHLPELAIQVLETQVVDPIERSQIRAREMASVAVEAIEMSIAQHGGTLTEQHGTGFEIRLPLCAEETAPWPPRLP